jgi:hypothetical protein
MPFAVAGWNPCEAPILRAGNRTPRLEHPNKKVWSLPLEPLSARGTERITLVPYGCTVFRVSMFPITRRAAWVLNENSSSWRSER